MYNYPFRILDHPDSVRQEIHNQILSSIVCFSTISTHKVHHFFERLQRDSYEMTFLSGLHCALYNIVYSRGQCFVNGR